MYYILGPNHTPTPVSSVEEWGQWMSTHDRQVDYTEVYPGILVSTVFLGLDHNYSLSGDPILFETMIFNDYDETECFRYCTWEDAQAGHTEIVSRLRAKLKLDGVN